MWTEKTDLLNWALGLPERERVVDIEKRRLWDLTSNQQVEAPRFPPFFKLVNKSLCQKTRFVSVTLIGNTNWTELSWPAVTTLLISPHNLSPYFHQLQYFRKPNSSVFSNTHLNILFCTLWVPRWSTTQLSVASRPTATVTLLTGSANFGPCVGPEKHKGKWKSSVSHVKEPWKNVKGYKKELQLLKQILRFF